MLRYYSQTPLYLRLLLCLWSLCMMASSLCAQDEISMDEVSTPSEALIAYCSPGISNSTRARGAELAYRRSTRYRWQQDPREQAVEPYEHLTATIRAPLLLRPRTKVLIGLRHSRERYSLSSVSPRDDKADYINFRYLKKSSLRLIAIHSLSEKNYAGIMLQTSYHGDYSGLLSLDAEYVIYRMAALYGWKWSEDSEMGIGVYVNNSFRGSAVLPFVLLNYNFSSRWGFESVLPAQLGVRYNDSPRSIFYAGAEFQSSSFYVARDTESLMDDFYVNDSHIVFKALWERQLAGWLWTELEIGYRMSRMARLEDPGPRPRTGSDYNQTNSAYIRVGIFLSPPDDMAR